MIKSYGTNDIQIQSYVEKLFSIEDSVLKKVRRQCQIHGLPTIQVSPMDGRHLEIFTKLIQAKCAVEIGTLGGYSGICIARGLHTKGHLYTLELDKNYARVAHNNYKLAKLSRKITIKVGPALTSLRKLEAKGPFDMVFIDADKVNYLNYLSWAEHHLRLGGLLIADNTFAWGKIAQAKLPNNDEKKSVIALRKFNHRLVRSKRLKATMIPTGEGMVIAVKVK